MSSRWITSIEHRPQDERIVYWIGNDAEPQQFGVTFLGDYQNCFRDGLVESMLMLMSIGDRQMDELEQGT